MAGEEYQDIKIAVENALESTNSAMENLLRNNNFRVQKRDYHGAVYSEMDIKRANPALFLELETIKRFRNTLREDLETLSELPSHDTQNINFLVKKIRDDFTQGKKEAEALPVSTWSKSLENAWRSFLKFIGVDKKAQAHKSDLHDVYMTKIEKELHKPLTMYRDLYQHQHEVDHKTVVERNQTKPTEPEQNKDTTNDHRRRSH